MENKKLQVGDKVLIKGLINLHTEIVIISDIDGDYAIIPNSNTILCREIQPDGVIMPKDTPSLYRYRLAKPEIQEEYHRNMLVRSIIGVDFSKLDTEKLEKISEILFEKINL